MIGEEAELDKKRKISLMLADVDGTLPARPPDAELLSEIGDTLGLGSSLTRFRAAVTDAAATERGNP